MSTKRTLEASIARLIGVEAGVDPRTVLAVYRGRRVRGMAGQRARAALERHGLLDARSGENPDGEMVIDRVGESKP